MAEIDNFSQPLEENIKLHAAENPWKPFYISNDPDQADSSLLVIEKLKRKVISILNKLTPQNFGVLLDQLKGLNINTEMKLIVICDLVYEKAITEPLYTALYAEMCKNISLLKVPHEKNSFINFRKILLTKCQKEFEMDYRINHEEKFKLLEECNKDTELLQEFCEKEKKLRSRIIGNIRFIGELFKLHMLIDPVIHECIQRLLERGDECSLECICCLLKIVGKELRVEKMEIYFTQLQKIVDDRSTSTRIRFMLEDVIHLKSGNWIPRRIENSPKTIDQIHKEAVQDMKKDAELHERELIIKSKELIESFLDNNDIEQATRNVIKLFTPGTINLFINEAINQVQNKSIMGRNSVGKLLISLASQNCIMHDQSRKVFPGVLDSRDDSSAISSIKNYITELLFPMFENDMYPLTFLKDFLQPCIPTNFAGEIVAAILNLLSAKRSNMELRKLWKESNFEWSDFFSEKENIQAFIHKHKLEFTTCLSQGEIKEHLLDFFIKTEENEKIFDWIDANVSEKRESNFIQTLVFAVHENAIKGNNNEYVLDRDEVEKRIPILSRYIDHDKNLELQALYALQFLMYQLNDPKGMLKIILDILYQGEVISEDSFECWKKSDNASESGKEIVLESVKTFIEESNFCDSVPNNCQ